MAFGGSDILKLIVDADTKGAVSEFNKLEKQAGSSLDGVEQKATGFKGKFQSAFGGVGGALAASFGPAAMAATVGAGIGIAINAASNLNEQVSKTKAVFGESSGEILKWSDSAATALGQSKTQALEAASSFGNMFKQLGLTGKAVVDMSTSMTGLASDFASFFNTDPAQALEAISSAFRGEFDAVQKFVPTITAAAVQQEVLKEGLAKTTGEITDQDKAVATYNLLLKGAGKASGDFARTSNSLANEQRILKAQVSDAAAAIGNQLLPPLAKLAGYASKAIEIVVDIKQKTGGDKSPFFMDLPHLISTAWKGITTGKPPWELFSDGVDKAADHSKAAGGTITSALGGIATVGMTSAKAAEVNAQTFGTFEARAAGIGHAMDEQAASIKGAEDALRSHTNAVLEATGSALGVSAAQREFNQAVIDADKVLKDSKATTDEKSAALDRETQAALDTATATVNYAQKQEEAQGKTLDAKSANDILISTLYTLAGKASPEVNAALAGVITKLQETGAQHPKPTVSVDDQATFHLADIQRKADALDRTTASVRVTADTSAARSAVNGIIAGFNRLPGTHIAPIATGTKNFAGGLALVGERGPELVMLPSGTMVKNAAETKAMMDGPSALPMSTTTNNGGSVNIVFSGLVTDEIAVGREIKRVLARAGYSGVS